MKQRYPAVRLFPAELYGIVKVTEANSEEKTPASVVTRLGTTISRVLVMGTMSVIYENNTDKQGNKLDSSYWRAEVITPIGTFKIDGDDKYTPEPAAFFRMNKDKCPFHCAVIDKLKVWTPPDDTNKHIVTIKPESIKQVNREDVEQWQDETADITLKRLEAAKTKWKGPEALKDGPVTPIKSDDKELAGYSDEEKKLIEEEMKLLPEEREDCGRY